ncbi:MAG: DMT family transporter [Nitrospinota bacterium]
MNPLLMAQVFSILTAIGFSAGDSSVRLALRTSTPITGILTLALLILLIYGPIAVATFPLKEIDSLGLLVFVAAGVASPGLAGTLYYMSFRRIGLSRSSTIGACAPLIMVLIAVVALGERPTPLVYLGTLLIMAGVAALAREQRSASRREPRGKSVWHYFIFAVLAMLMFAVAAALRKVGLSMIPSLSVALSLAAIGTLLVVALWHPFLPQEDRVKISRHNIGYFLASGILSSSGHLAFFAALQRGPLSTVAPLVYTTPLFALAFSWLLFREVERLNSRLVAGALIVCAGAVLVTMSRV